MLVARRLHLRRGGIDEVQFRRLLDEFIPVGQDEGPAAAPLDQEGKHNAFAVPVGNTSKGRCTPRAVAASRAATAPHTDTAVG